MNTEDLQNIGDDFYSNLEDLTFNSKPIITNLTIIAEENTEAATYIVRAVEKRIEKAIQTQKLFSFYLLDSICKNIGSPYTVLFAENLTKTFTTAYVSVDDLTRKKMIDLFRTWKDAVNSSGLPLFPTEPIKKIEDFLIKASSLYQPMIPVTARQTPTPTPTLPQKINVQELLDLINRIAGFYAQKLRMTPNDEETKKKIPVLTQVTQAIQQQTMPYSQLIEAKNMLVKMYKNEEESLKALTRPPPPQRIEPAVGEPQHPLKKQFQQFVNNNNTATQGLPPATINNQQVTTPPQISNNETSGFVQSGRYVNPLGLASNATVSIPKPNYDSLLKKLLKAKLVKYKNQKLPSKEFLRSLLTKPKKQFKDEKEAGAENNIPIIDLSGFDINSSTLLKNSSSYNTFHRLMFDAKPHKCDQCGKRFGKSKKELKLRADHLDWHFRINSKLQNSTVIPSKAWYLDDEDFLKFRDLELFYSAQDYPADGYDTVNLNSANGTSKSQGKSNFSGVDNQDTVKHYVTVPETSLDMQTQCGICRETIKGEYDDDLGEWIYKNSVMGPHSKVFHWACFNEANQKKDSASGGVKRKYEFDLDDLKTLNELGVKREKV